MVFPKDSTDVISYRARHVLIATGGKPSYPKEATNTSGIVEHSITSDGFFALEELPRKVVVVGAGYIAVELAGVLNSLGTEVCLVIRKQKALRDFDDMLSDTLDEEMTKHGVIIYRNSEGVKRITTTTTNTTACTEEPLKTVELNNGEVISDVDCVIMATGREPSVEKLNLSNVGVEQKPDTGHIVVNDYSETTADNIYALGDVVGKVELTPIAIAAGRRLADRLFGPEEFKDAKVSYDLVPTIVFTHPPIGTIGLTETRAIEKYGASNIKVYRSKFPNMYYGPWQVELEDKPKTAMKLICAGREELVVGLHVIGMGADEMLQGYGIALKMGATKADFDSCTAIHPTASEEFVTMFPWGMSMAETGAKVSPLNGAETVQPRLMK